MLKNDRQIGYRMTRRMFNDILSHATDKDNPYAFVMNYLNEQNNLRGKVCSISIKEDE